MSDARLQSILQLQAQQRIDPEFSQPSVGIQHERGGKPEHLADLLANLRPEEGVAFRLRRLSPHAQ